ncbi:Crp/Fnr family transcriptional regulator, partial [Cohnella pontilimi]
VEKLVFRDLRGKVLYFLNRLSKKFGIEENGYQKIDFPLTHQELANMIGATREAVSLTLQELSNEGILVTSRRMVMIHIGKAMKELA